LIEEVFEIDNWVNTLFNTRRRRNLFNMFNKRNNNQGIIWASLLSLGISAAALGLRRNGNRNMLTPVQNLMNNFRFRNNGQMPKMASAITEFSKELAPNKNPFTNK
jgi:hypothetical protein